MATTTEPSKLETLPFTEHDKLGPLGGRAAVLDNDAELRRVLVREFQTCVDAARDAVGKVDGDAASAVHAYRKALRRARAVLALIGGALPKSERRAVRRALQEARRALGTARDHAVAPDTVAHLSLGEIERDAAAAILHAADEAMPPVAEIKQLLAEGAARAAAQVEALEAALPPAIAWKTVSRGVRGVYEEARAARKAARHGKRAFHTWRRRSKELGYALDVLAQYAGPALAELQHEIEGVTDTQGPAVDLIMLRDFVRTYGHGLAPEACDHLLAAIDSHLDDLMKDSRRAGRATFAPSPRKFRRRLTRAKRADVQPPADHDGVASA
jgi:CHAD domain-containing protein